MRPIRAKLRNASTIAKTRTATTTTTTMRASYFYFFFDTLNYGINEITKTKALEPNEKEISVLPQNNKKNYETSHKHPTKTSMILNKY